MKKILLLLLTINCSMLTANSQTQWQRTIGGTGIDYAYSIIQTTDGGYAVAGYTNSFGAGNYDMYIVKLDASGTLQWRRTVGGTNIDYAVSIIQTTDGGYAVAGHTNSFGAGNYEMYIVKLDASGALQWNKNVGGGSNNTLYYSIIQTIDGGYAVAYSTGGGDMYIIKLDTSGTLQWSRTVGGTGSDIARSIIQTTDGGYVVAGDGNSFGAGSSDIYIVKLDGSGTLQWSRTVGGTNVEYALSIIQTTDGGYAVAGYTSSFGAGNADMYIVKLDASGTLQWSRTVGGTNIDYALSIIRTTDGGYAVAGYGNSFGAGNYDMYIVKLDFNGTLQWSRTVGGTNVDDARSIIQTTDGGYAVAGTTIVPGGSNEMYIVKLDASGNTCGNSSSPSSLSGTGGTTTSPTPTVTSPTPTVTSPTSLTSTGGMVTTICTTVGITRQQNEIPQEYKLEQNYPNPFNPSTVIHFDIPKQSFTKLIIYNVLGKIIETLVSKELNPGRYEVTFDAGKLTSGMYFYKLETKEFTEVKKMILMK